ncbi:hypothetical protein J7444_23655 [Labrenzia sp. R4_1]|uniref:calcium-binding protein n=1 Tax=Labrenzia sp. R4_1 TaxID=2821106 RepID=UPI001ADAA9C7|nr:hypothetical protein [Labrenzia sp. R4_1]MBO9427754.1 hypothetical protein [Labrenzia sp. R4_1]
MSALLTHPFSFDADFYLASNLDVAAAIANGSVSDARTHFQTFGAAEGRDPHAFFDSTYYLNNNADVKAAVEAGTISSAFEHYLEFGAAEGRAPAEGLSFNEAQYLSLYPDVSTAIQAGTSLSGANHFISFGYDEGRFSVTSDSNTLALEVRLITSPTDVAGGTASDILIAGGDPGASLTFDLSATDQTPLPGTQSGYENVDFSAILGSDGHTFIGSSGVNTIIATSGADSITGGVGADILIGGEGADQFNFAAGDTTSPSAAAGGITWDVLIGFDVGSDKISFGTTPASVAFTDVNVGALGAQGADLAAAFSTLENLVVAGGDAELAANGVQVFRAGSVGEGFNNDLLNATYVFADVDGVAGWLAGTDTVLQILGASDALSSTDFV